MREDLKVDSNNGNNENMNNGSFSGDANENGGMFTGNMQENGYDPNGSYTQNSGYDQNNGYNQQGTYTYGSQGYQYPQQGGYERELEEPMSLGECVVTLLLLTFVPCVNIVLLFVWGFSDKEKKSKSNLCKAYLIIMGIGIAVYILFLIVMVGIAASIGI